MFNNRTLWIVQVVLGVYFVAVGISHFIVPEGLPDAMAWMYDLSDPLHIISGSAEILGGLGLIVPGLTKIRPELTVLAAEGLIIVMLGATIWHLTRSESNFVFNLVLIALLAWITYGRYKKTPLSGSVEPAAA